MTTSEKNNLKLESNNRKQELLNVIYDYILTGVHRQSGNKLPFSLVDYYCLTDIPPAELLAHLRRHQGSLLPMAHTIVSCFLIQYVDLGDEVNVERLEKEKLTYIINGQRMEITKDHWANILDRFQELHIPARRQIVDVAARRIAYGQPIFPILDSTYEQQHGPQYRKNK